MRCAVGRRDGDGERLEAELFDGDRFFDLDSTGFFVCFGDVSIDDDDEPDSDSDDGVRFFAGSGFLGFRGLRLCFGDADDECRRSRRMDVELFCQL